MPRLLTRTLASSLAVLALLATADCLHPHAVCAAQDHAVPTDIQGTPDALIPVKDRKPAPDFTLTDLQGQKVTLSSLKGKVVLLDFWATWCGGCKVELPWYVEFHNRYAGKGLAVIGVSMDDGGPALVRNFATQKGLNYPIVIGSEALGDRFHLESMPLTLLIDRQGRIAVSHSGIVDRANFDQHLRDLLS